MLKRLAIFAISALMAVSVSSQPNKTANSNQQVANTKHARAAKPSPEKESETDHNKAKADPDPPEWHAAIKGPEWWLVIVGFATLIVVGWQTAILGKSVSVARESAKTSGRQVELYANAERARITMDISDIGKRSFRIRGKNTGRVVAEIILARGYSVILPYGESLPAVPPYLSEPNAYEGFVEFTPPNEFIEPIPDGEGYVFRVDLSSDTLCVAIRDREYVLWAYGRICYRDGISSLLRETRFCYEAAVYGDMETDLLMSGPESYRKAT